MSGATGAPARGPRRFEFLDGLRGLLAVYVVMTHVIACDLREVSRPFQLATRFFRYGQFAVDGFIVLSGFSLMLPVAASADRRLRDGFGGYLRRRARRILPPDFAALALGAAILAAIAGLTGRSELWRTDLSPTALGSHLLLVHTLVPGHAETINPAFWSIATEWHIYFFFPLLLLPIFRRFGAAGMVAVAVVVGSLPQFVARDSEIVRGCPWLLGLFALGAATASAFAAPGFSPRATLRRLPWLFASGFVAYAVGRALVWSSGLKEVFGPRLLSDLAAGILWSCVILYGACVERIGDDEGSPRRPLFLRIVASPPAMILGGFSYSLYATHTPLLRALEFTSRRLGLAPVPDFLIRFFVGIPLALGVAALFARWFERPFLSSRPRALAREGPGPAAGAAGRCPERPRGPWPEAAPPSRSARGQGLDPLGRLIRGVGAGEVPEHLLVELQPRPFLLPFFSVCWAILSRESARLGAGPRRPSRSASRAPTSGRGPSASCRPTSRSARVPGHRRRTRARGRPSPGRRP